MNASGYVETLGARLYYQDWGAGSRCSSSTATPRATGCSGGTSGS